jgi:hypothetical protein
MSHPFLDAGLNERSIHFLFRLVCLEKNRSHRPNIRIPSKIRENLTNVDDMNKRNIQPV